MKKLLVIIALIGSSNIHSMQKKMVKFASRGLAQQANNGPKKSNLVKNALLGAGIGFVGYKIYTKFKKYSLERDEFIKIINAAEYVPTITEVVDIYADSIIENFLDENYLITFLQYNLYNLDENDIETLLNAIVKSKSPKYLKAFIEGASSYYLSQYPYNDAQNALLIKQLFDKFPAGRELSALEEKKKMLTQIIELQNK